MAQVARETVDLGQSPVFYRAVNVSDPVQVAAVAGEICGKLGTPDIVLNNAGVGRWLSLIETEPADAMELTAAP